jgi:hypothetical protein
MMGWQHREQKNDTKSIIDVPQGIDERRVSKICILEQITKIQLPIRTFP